MLDLAGIEGQAKADAISNIANAVAAYKVDGNLAALQAVVAAEGLEMAGESLVMRNVAPDEGLSASFNSWFTLFGQFFDHGLDLVAKGQSGTVFIPLQSDDPLYVEGSPTNFMVLTRATVNATGRGQNLTTPFVDQNQTYTSHPSHQVFLREYVNDLMLRAGRHREGFLTASPWDCSTWAEVKAQARRPARHRSRTKLQRWTICPPSDRSRMATSSPGQTADTPQSRDGWTTPNAGLRHVR